MTEPIHCFLDESGDPHFPAGEPGKSTHFVVAAVVVPESRLNELRVAAEAIRRRHFGAGEMKCKDAFGWKRQDRRQALLEEIAGLEASFAVVAVDKRELFDDGPLAKWKRSFIKYTSSLLYSRLFASHDSVHVVADEYGSEGFQEEFGLYVAARRIPDLFRPMSTFAFGESKSEPLIQAADMVAGTVFRAYREPTDETRGFVRLLRPRLHTFISWPPIYPPVEPPRRAGEQQEFDLRVRDYALSQAARYLSQHRASSDPLSVARVATMDRLVFAAQFEEGSSFVHADELVRHLNSLRLPFNVSKRWLNSHVIGPLRDDGVVITGSSRGYAIPFRVAELDAHARDVRSKSIPMLRRLGRYRADLALRTGGRLDLLASAELADVKRLVETVSGLDPGAPAGNQ